MDAAIDVSETFAADGFIWARVAKKVIIKPDHGHIPVLLCRKSFTHGLSITYWFEYHPLCVWHKYELDAPPRSDCWEMWSDESWFFLFWKEIVLMNLHGRGRRNNSAVFFRDGIRLGLVTKTSPESRFDPEGTSPGRTCGYPDSDSHVPSPGTQNFWGGYKLLFQAGTLILRKIICTYVGYICT